MSRPPTFRLHELPVEEAARSLQALAAAALHSQLLGREEPLPAEDLAFWNRLDTRGWSDPPPRRWRPGRRDARWAHLQFRKALCHRQEDLPDVFLSLASTAAWSLPGFELTLWEAVRERLRQEMPWSDDLERGLRIAPQALWANIALATLQPAAMGRRPARAVRGGARRIRAIARQRILHTQAWAGFWDQWLVDEAMARVETTHLKEDWLVRLRWMPFLRHRRGIQPVHLSRRSGEGLPASPDWSTRAPPRLLAYYEYMVRPPAIPHRAGASNEAPPG